MEKSRVTDNLANERQTTSTRRICQTFAKQFFHDLPGNLRKRDHRFIFFFFFSLPRPLGLSSVGKECSSRIQHSRICARCPRDAIMMLEQKQISNNSRSVVFNTYAACVRSCARGEHAHMNTKSTCMHARKRHMIRKGARKRTRGGESGTFTAA